MSIGIYKWTSPTGRIYVGQSSNLKQRLEWYKGGGLNKSKMFKIKRSFNKYGIENHIFEEIEYCSLEQLNEREIYWGLFYNVLKKGLNCKLGEQNCIFSESTKNKMSKAKIGKPLSIEHQLNREKSLQKYWEMTRENKVPKKKYNGNYIPTQEHRENISKSKIGKSIHTNESKTKLSIIGKQRDMTKIHQAAAKSNSIPINQYNINGEFIKSFISAQQAEMEIKGKKGDRIRACIRGEQKTAYGYIWKESELN
jgi:group I intron endonuclease